MNIIEELKAALAAATQGEWKVERNNQDQCTVVVLDGSLRTKVAVTHPTWICEEHGGTTFDNSLLIALMHNALPALIECAERLREAQEALDVLAEDASEAGFPGRAEDAATLAMECRAALAKLENAK